jgi:hypothetical protein
MLGSNQRPLPCEGSTIGCWRCLEIAKCLQIVVFLRRRISLRFRRFIRVVAWLLRRGYGLYPHKVRDDRYSTSGLEAAYTSFALGSSLLKNSPAGRVRNLHPS